MPFCYFEGGAGDDDVGCVGAAGPFLAVDAVARNPGKLVTSPFVLGMMVVGGRRGGHSWELGCWAGEDVPEGCHLGFAGVFIGDLAAHAGAFCHCGGCLVVVVGFCEL